jgi:hypothetical protein
VKLNLGISPADTTPATHPVPASQPETVVENTRSHYEHKARDLNRGRNDTSKPADARQVGGDLPQSRLNRKTNQVIAHTETSKGKTAYYTACYENSKGEQGKRPPVEEAVIG